MPRVGVNVAVPGTEAMVAVGVNVGLTGALVAVSSVVVRFGAGGGIVGVDVSIVAVLDGPAIGGVDVWVTGADVNVGRAVNVCATEVFAMASTVPAISTAGPVLGPVLGAGVGMNPHAPKTNTAIIPKAIFFIMPSFRATPHAS